MKIKIKKLTPDAITPTYATDGSGCFDIYTISEGATVNRGDAEKFSTGLAFEIPKGYVMLVYSRSGHGFNSQVRLSNCVGVIDSDFRGELQIKLHNDGLHPLNHRGTELYVRKGDRIAQAMIIKVDQVEFEEVKHLSSTNRGEGGFGSTGR